MTQNNITITLTQEMLDLIRKTLEIAYEAQQETRDAALEANNGADWMEAVEACADYDEALKALNA